MKRCSTCNRTYTDPNLSFCIDDGTPLTTVELEDEATVVSPQRKNEDERKVAAAYQPPGSYVPPGAEGKRRRAWPWVLGIAGAFILGIVAISIAAAILAPRLISRQREHITERPDDSQPENRSTPATRNANQNSPDNLDAPPPTDNAQVLVQLTEIENDWTAANLNADKKALERILADDYVGQFVEGGLQGKADYIGEIQRDTSVDRWDFSDLKLKLTGDRATLSGTITYVIRSSEVVFDFTDKFVWRDGRWQATGSEIARKDETNVNY